MTPPEVYAVRNSDSRPDTPGWKVRVVPNKYPALGMDSPFERSGSGIFSMMGGFGAHEVIIETPDHVREAKEQRIDEITCWLRALQERVKTLYADHRFKYVLVFKNKGKGAGASLSHPHHQLIATPVTPKRVKEELIGAQEYFKKNNRCIFCDIIEQELRAESRIVHENEFFVAFCPYASRFPFEIWILPKRHSADFYTVQSADNISLCADILRIALRKLSKAIGEPEYNYIIHAAPNKLPQDRDGETVDESYHWHIELFPRLIKTAGFEWGTGFYINPTLPESAARFMRELK